jgi:glycosyltransferase involved in cell wall biosynthesis
VLKDAMYVNSSDYEGISNAMLEAMAIGMPVVCTDCPVGGAALVIKNNVNGMLVEVGNCEQLSWAISKILSDKEFSQTISRNASNIRQKLSIENIGKQWLEII